MTLSYVELIARQRSRVDHMARTAGRFMDEPTAAALLRLSVRLGRLGTALAASPAGLGDARHRIDGQLERLVRDVGLLRIDDPATLARVTWVLAEMEEALRTAEAGRHESGPALMPVYTAGR